MGVNRITLGVGGGRIRVLHADLRSVMALLNKIKGRSIEMKELRFRAANIFDLAISLAYVENFRQRQRSGGWKPTSFLALVFSRQIRKLFRKGAIGKGFSEMDRVSSLFPPLEDSGRLKRSLYPIAISGNADHILRIRNGVLQIGTRVPYAAGHLYGEIRKFKRDISWVRPGKKGVPGSGRPLSYTEQTKTLFDVVDPPSKANNYFANRLRWGLVRFAQHTGGEIVKKLPIRSWLGVGRGSINRLVQAAVRFMRVTNG